MAKNPRKHTLCSPLSIDQLSIFGVFEHEWGTWTHVDDLQKILMVHISTKENRTYNLKDRSNARAVKSSRVVIFEDTKCSVVSLIKRLTTISKSKKNIKTYTLSFTGGKKRKISGESIYMSSRHHDVIIASHSNSSGSFNNMVKI